MRSDTGGSDAATSDEVAASPVSDDTNQLVTQAFVDFDVVRGDYAAEPADPQPKGDDDGDR